MTLDQLEQLLAARLKPEDLPHTVTRGEADAYARETASLDHRLVTAKSAMAVLAELSEDGDVEWLDHLHTWRKQLCDELLEIKSPIRDKLVMGRSINLTLSIKCVDFGLGQLRDSGRELTNLRIGELMVASGFAVVGALPERHYAGTLPWRGSIKEVENRMKETEKRRVRALQQLDSALLDDDVRAEQEAVAKRRRDVLNGLRLRGPNLRVVGPGNEDIDEKTLTDEQRAALAHARAAFSETVTQ